MNAGYFPFSGSSIPDSEVEAFRVSGQFDEQWYLAEYPDVAKSGINPARHYLWIGRKLGRKPSPQGKIQTAELMYDSAIEDVPPADSSPSGLVYPVSDASGVRLTESTRRALSRRSGGQDDYIYDLISKHFDEDFYLSNYPDIAAANVDPIQHYLDNGWRENRDPALTFSTKFYADNNPDVIEAGVNPFFHYLAAGKAEGRQGKHNLGFRWDILSNLKTVADQIKEFKSYRKPVKMSNTADLNFSIIKEISNYSKIVVSFSHDNYTENIGGIQLLLRRELKLLNARGYMQIHLFPVHSLPFVETSNEQVSLGVLVNGKHVGNFLPRDIKSSLSKVRLERQNVTFIAHSLLGHKIEDAIDFISAIDAQKGIVWLHDYSPLYNNFKLLRNDVSYSGFPRTGSLARELCEFARAEFSHPEEFRKLFDRFEVALISPSQAALEIWNDAGLLQPASSHVVHHIKLTNVQSDRMENPSASGPLRIGFLGYPAAHKGWPVFQELALRYKDDPRYEFYHLGNNRRGGVPAIYREVSANESEMDAMRSAVAEVPLDVALLWSIWPETFCLTAYEALAAGAAVITNPMAGNIVHLVKQTGEGAIIADEAALDALFDSGDIQQYSRLRRPVRHFAMDYSALSLEIMD
jgi:hypothetical protein